MSVRCQGAWRIAGLLLVLDCFATAQDVTPAPQAGAAFDAAVSAYKARDYDAASEGFAGLAATEPDAGRRAVLHANAGTAAARADAWGEAIWHLEAARRADPHDAVTRRNLAQVQAQAQLGQADDDTSAFAEQLLLLPLAFTRGQVNGFVAALITLALLLLAARRAGLTGRRSVWCATLLLVLAGSTQLGGDLARAWDAGRAVVVHATAVRAEPTPGGKLLFRLAPGTVVRDEEQRADWRLIETSAGARGWVPVDDVRSAGA